MCWPACACVFVCACACVCVCVCVPTNFFLIKCVPNNFFLRKCGKKTFGVQYIKFPTFTWFESWKKCRKKYGKVNDFRFCLDPMINLNFTVCLYFT